MNGSFKLQKISHAPYRKDIQIWRAIAFLLVFANHLSYSLAPYGYLGVDIFFVISGFVITQSSLNRLKNETPSSFLLGFYARRAKRIFPALLFYLLIFSLLIVVLNPYSSSSLSSAKWSVFGISNLYFSKSGLDYFGQDLALNPFTQTWSLGVEEQFYFLAPLFSFLFLLKKNILNKPRNQYLILGSIALISFSFYVSYFIKGSNLYFYMPYSRAWEILIGVLVAILPKIIFKNKFLNLNILSMVFSFIVILFCLIPKNIIPDLVVMLSVPIFTGFSIYLSEGKSPLEKIRLNIVPIFLFIGKISYSLYLWHWGVIVILRWLGVNSGFNYYFCAISLSLFLSYFSYSLIEKNLQKLSINNLKLIILSIVTIFSANTILGLINKYSEKIYSNYGNLLYTPKYPLVEALAAKKYCNDKTKFLNQSVMDYCFLGSEVKKNIFVVGDSHSGNIFPSIVEASRSLLNSNSVFKVRYVPSNLDATVEEKICSLCKDPKLSDLKGTLDQLAQPGDLIFFAISRDRLKYNRSLPLPRDDDQSKTASFKFQLKELAQYTKDNNLKLTLIHAFPKLCTSKISFLVDVLNAGRLERCSISSNVSEMDRKSHKKIINEVALDFKINHIDFHDVLCPDSLCSPVLNDDEIIYMDSSPHFREDNQFVLKDFFIDYFNSQKSTY